MPTLPAAGGAAAGFVGSALYLVQPRGPSSQEELELDWDHPVLQSRVESSDAAGSRSMLAKRALSVAEAYVLIAGKDRRPLLVLRECLTCSGTDDALLTRQADNEKTLLYSRWFHLVKLPPDVLEPDHPFHALFAGDAPGHLFVARTDGSGRIDLRGDQSRTELWKVMETLLASEYAGPTDKPLKELAKLLDEMDQVDRRIRELEGRLDDAEEKSGPDSLKARKARKALEEERTQLAALRERAHVVSDVPLRVPPPRVQEGEGEAGSEPRSS